MSSVAPASARTVPVPQKRPADCSLTARVEVGNDGSVVAADPTADRIFSGLFHPGRSLDQCLDEGEKRGVLPAGTRPAFLQAIESDTGPHLFETTSRSMLLALDQTRDGSVILEMTDVSHVVKTTLSRQRDPLTGLPNRLELHNGLEQKLAASTLQSDMQGDMQGDFALLYIDLDRFKAINDTLGHPTGDKLLKRVAERLSRLVRPGDILARLGGDEFAFLQASGLPADDPRADDLRADGHRTKAAERLAAHIIDLVSRTYLIDGHAIQIGASVGIALPAPNGDTAEDLLKNADIALFKAKSQGRSTFRFFTSAMDADVKARRALEIELRRAVVLQEFSLVFQPQFRIRDRKLLGFEALLRWTSPSRGPVSPAVFIPLAEDIGIIQAIGDWVLNAACKEAASWSEPLTVSINLSPHQFKTPGLVDTIRTALAEAGLSPDRLDLEITEGALLDDTEAVLSMLGQIKALGIKVSMDDFGTGYSSLGYLQKFAFDKIKIDQSFIRNLGTCSDSAAIVRAVIRLGDSLGMTTIAEGVETEDQLARIAMDGCLQVQGYLTGKPLPVPDISAFIQERHQETPMPLFRLVYYSASTMADDAEAFRSEVDQILARSRENNRRVDVTGALMFSAGHFGQVLEGPQSAIEATFERIQQDPRHGDVSLLAFEPTQERTFDSWAMAYVGEHPDAFEDLAIEDSLDTAKISANALYAKLKLMVAAKETDARPQLSYA